MERYISAAEANRKFSYLIRSVREEGSSYVVTSHGRPVAKITAIEESKREDRTKSAAFKVLIRRLRSQSVKDLGHWTREELYEEES